MLGGMNAPLLTRDQSRQVDALATEQYGIPGMVLMENAGRGVVDVLLDTCNNQNSLPRQVGILCGKGNNAGDGFVVARHLEICEIPTKVVLFASPADLRGDARQNYEILTHTGVPIVDLSETTDLTAALDAELAGADWLVDAMLGTGAQGEPREPYRTAIEWMNAQPVNRLALDVPSGLDCDTGKASAVTVRADSTCTFAASKVGFAEQSAQDYLGKLHVVSIGTPPGLLESVNPAS